MRVIFFMFNMLEIKTEIIEILINSFKNNNKPNNIYI